MGLYIIDLNENSKETSDGYIYNFGNFRKFRVSDGYIYLYIYPYPSVLTKKKNPMGYDTHKNSRGYGRLKMDLTCSCVF